jgi:hypothetical protein
LASGDIGIHELEHGILIGLLSKLDSDGGRSIGNEVLHLSAGDIGIHKLEDGVFIGFLDVSIKLDELLGNGRGLVLDEGLKGLLGDVLTVELANDGLGGLSGGLLESRSSIRDGVVSIIIRETLIELGGEELTTIPLVEDLSTSGRRNSSDHHGDGDVVVIIRVLNLVSILAEDGGESIITDNFSESLEGDAINDISVEFGVAIDVDGVNLINRDHERLTISDHVSGRQVHGGSSPDRGTISIDIDIGNNLVEGVLGRSLLSLVMLVVVLLLELHEILLSGYSLESVVLRQEGGQVLSNGRSEFSLGHGVGTFLNHSLMESGGEGLDFLVDLAHGSRSGGINANGEKESNSSDVLENTILFHFNIINNKILGFINNYFNKPSLH